MNAGSLVFVRASISSTRDFCGVRLSANIDDYNRGRFLSEDQRRKTQKEEDSEALHDFDSILGAARALA